MLKGIPNLISPELLKVMDEMGHGDTIVLADSSFPAASLARKSNAVYLRESNCRIPEMLDAMLTLLPLDSNVEKSVILMNSEGQKNRCEIPIWNDYQKILEKHMYTHDIMDRSTDRFAFYKKASSAYCILQTAETAIYANIILQKGFV